MIRFASLHRVLLYSAFMWLSAVLGIFPTTQQASTQTNFRSLRNNLSPKFSKEALLNPSVFQQADKLLIQSEFLVDQAKGKIRLKSKFFGAQKFIYNEKAPQNVYGFWGLTFKSEFQESLSLHPDALKEAKKAYPFNALSFVGALGFVVVSAKMLIDSINDSQEISNGRLVDGGSSTTDVVLICVTGSVTIVSGILGKKHLENGVRIFNERQN